MMPSSLAEPPNHPPSKPSAAARPPARGFVISGILSVVLAAGVAAVLWNSQKNRVQDESTVRATEFQAGPRVAVTPVRPSAPEHALSLQAEARPYASVTLYAKVSGYLRELRVDKGDRVKANQILATIESPETDKQYEAAHEDARNKQQMAQRARTLSGPGVVSQQEADQAITNAAMADATLASLVSQKGYEVLRAPFDGTVTARFADPGALVQNAANSQTSALPVVTISQVDRLRIYAYIDQRDAAFVHIGDLVEIEASERPQQKLHAAVTRLSGELDPKTRMMLTEIDYDNRNHDLIAGSFVTITLHMKSPSYLELPSQALILRMGKPLVGVVTPDNTVTFRPIVLVDDDGQTMRTASGLEAGDRVAVNLGDSVSEGSRVQPISAPTPQPVASASAAASSIGGPSPSSSSQPRRARD